MNRPPEPPPEGVLIESARRDARLSMREAARRAGISDGWWRQVVKGYQPTGEGGYILRHGPADTVAKMAAVVKLNPERMEAEGRRPDAAEVMSEAGRHEVTAPAPSRSAFPLPPPTEAMARQLAPFLAEAEARVRVAQAASPGQRLTGKQVYPDLPEGAAYWDALTDAGFAPEHIAPSVATMLAMSADRAEAARRQGGHAAGLGRRPVLQARR